MIPWMARRLHRRALLGFVGGGFLVSFFYGLAFKQAAGSTAASQAAFGHSISLVAGQFAFLIPVPVHPETLGGYEQYKWLSGAIVLMMIWAALTGVGVGRGDEERGVTDEWLASGVSRTHLVLARSAAFAMVLAVACLASVLGIVAAAPLVSQDPNLTGELLKALSMVGGVFTFYTIALLLSQLPAERQTATAVGVAVPVVLLVVNGLADTITSAAWIGVVSPFHWMERTTSGAPGGQFDTGGTVGLGLAAALILALAIFVFRRRDIGSGLVGWGRRRGAAVRLAATNPMLRTPFTESLWEQRVGLAVWVASMLAISGLMVSVTRSVGDSLFSDPRLAALFLRGSTGSPYASLLGLTWLGMALLVLAGYAVVQVSRWATQDQQGRVEMLLSAPISRSRVILDRAIEFAVASLLIVAGGYIGVALSLPGARLQLDPGHVLTASFLLWPFALAFGGLGVALASRWPNIAVALLAAFAAVEYFLGDLAPLFRLPAWTANLSIFHLYGNPLVDSSPLMPALTMTLVFVVGFGAALALMRRQDVSTA
jgi:ABC-2 type transport system permease protein